MNSLPTTAQQRGVALLTVLFILVLLTTLLVYVVEDDHLAIRRASNQRDAEQGYQLAVGAEQWAMKILARDAQQNKTDHLAEPWYTLLPEVAVEQGSLSSRVIDLQGRFNLNNLSSGRDKVWYPAFQRLLRVLDLDEGLADAVLDWIDADQDLSGNDGAEDPQYLSRTPPYRAGNRMFSDVGELIWVQGFDAEKIALLSEYVTALPQPQVKINVNTAPVPVLRILGKDLLAESAAQTLADGRGDAGYEAIADVLKVTELAGQGDTAEPLITVSSNFFQVLSEAEFGRFNLLVLTTLERRPQTSQVLVLKRRRGLT